jgi:hypothetical protein
LGGFAFANGLFMGASVKAPYSNPGVNFPPKAPNTFKPYLIIDTLHKNSKPNDTLLTLLPCPYRLTARSFMRALCRYIKNQLF